MFIVIDLLSNTRKTYIYVYNILYDIEIYRYKSRFEKRHILAVASKAWGLALPPRVPRYLEPWGCLVCIRFLKEWNMSKKLEFGRNWNGMLLSLTKCLVCRKWNVIWQWNWNLCVWFANELEWNYEKWQKYPPYIKNEKTM